jgi:hypothetical protein
MTLFMVVYISMSRVISAVPSRKQHPADYFETTIIHSSIQRILTFIVELNPSAGTIFRLD